MDFRFSEHAIELQNQLNQFMDTHVIPQIGDWHKEVAKGNSHPQLIEDLKALAKAENLWNLFLPKLNESEPGQRLTNLEYAPLAEIMGRVPFASEVFNCSAPDTGNMEVFHMFGTDEQKERWLKPLFAGEIRSCFAMTEPDVASSDATNIQTLITRDGDDYIISGRKWFISGAAHPNCKIAIVMGRTDPDAHRHSQQSMILVPLDTSGVNIIRNISVMGHLSTEGHCEIVFDNVRVPATNLLGDEGCGFAMAQARLGPGRIHHCMRSIGQCELALELMSARALERKAFGKLLSEQGKIQEWIALSRMEIEQARLLVLKTAWMIDHVGTKNARMEISMIKAIIPKMQTTILDRAMQTFGAMGVSPDTPLAQIWSWGRALRFADGPDEVHIRSVAKLELAMSQKNIEQTKRFLTPYDDSTNQ